MSNPYRLVEVGIELGFRVRDALMTRDDWRDMLVLWSVQQGLPVELLAGASPDLGTRAEWTERDERGTVICER